ncbi:tetratricopeptide repeat protein [Actinophytocola sp.]|uniref:tetratricopeptide repeat protein n=1 Tax=Actinophytocola sp. TaxID=1872138 RepID=UPI00389AEABA
MAVANGSLFGVGYGMLGKRLLAVGAGVVTVVLVVLLVTVFQELWLEIVVLGWWVAVVAHGWWLAGKQAEPPVPGAARRQRLVALAVALPVLLVVGFLRFDAGRIEQDVADARQAGDCGKATHALDGRWLGHRIANAPLAAEQDGTARACDLLRQATTDLDAALDGDAAKLPAGMAAMRTVLSELPGHEKMVGTTLDRFLGRLPTDDACDTKEITDRLGREPREPRERRDKTVLDRTADVVPRIAPKAIVECGDDLMAANNWSLARERYQQLLDEYPDHDLAPRATAGVTKATQAIELANVRQLLTSTAGEQPAYCTSPAPYSGAVAYGATRPNRALFFGNNEYTDRLPPEWKATDAADAVVVVCAGAAEMGAPVRTCPYESTLSVLGYTDVTFKKISIPVKVYEVRTARLVADTRVEIGGATCPAVLEYQTTGYVDLGPPSEMYVTAADPDVHAGFSPLVNP